MTNEIKNVYTCVTCAGCYCATGSCIKAKEDMSTVNEIKNMLLKTIATLRVRNIRKCYE